jgi:hypothetical protein
LLNFTFNVTDLTTADQLFVKAGNILSSLKQSIAAGVIKLNVSLPEGKLNIMPNQD